MHRRHSLSGRLAALLLTLLFVLVHAYVAEAAASFSDVSADAWYAEAVQYVWEQGWMTGTDAAAFSPDLVMTRGMLVTVLYRAAGSPALEDENLGYPFTDVPAAPGTPTASTGPDSLELPTDTEIICSGPTTR